MERETFEVGEQINSKIAELIHAGIKTGELRQNIPILPTVFLFWAALGELIQMAADKQAYIEKAMDEFFHTSGMKRLGAAVFSSAKGKTQLPRRVSKKIERFWFSPTFLFSPTKPPQS